MKRLTVATVLWLNCVYSFGQDLPELSPISRPEAQDDDRAFKTEEALRKNIISHSYLQFAYANPNSYPDNSLTEETEPVEVIASAVNYLVLRRTSGPSIRIKIKEKKVNK